MKNRYEDDVIRLAFGDLDGNEAEAVRERIAQDPAAARLYSAYSGMAEGLKGMEAPEHQLSTERLRHQILNQGLKDKAPLLLRWAWAPVAMAAVIAVGWVLTRPQGESSAIKAHPAPRVVNDLNSGNTDPEISRELSAISPTILNPEQPVGAQPEVTTHHRRSARTVSEVPTSRESQRIPTRGALAMLKKAEPGLEVIEAAIADAAVETDTNDIVIIGAETDADTGARKATEVPSPSNVVIGG